MKKSLTAMLVMVTLPVLAQFTGNDQTLVLPLTSEQVTSEQGVEEMARVVTSMSRPADCLGPVAVNRIDGEARLVSAQGFLIEPGVHTINGRATLDLSDCPLIDNKLTISNAADLEVDFEPGGTYYIGYHHPPANTEQWKLLVWRTENVPDQRTYP